MAFAQRPDGLYDVTLDGGLTLPMGLTEEQLRAAGHEPLAPNPSVPLPPNAVAGPGGAPTEGLDAPPPASFFQQQSAAPLPSIAEQQGAHGAAPPVAAPAPIAPAGPPAPRPAKGSHETPRNVPNAAGGQVPGYSAAELDDMSEPEAALKPDELVAYEPEARGTGGAPAAPTASPARGGGGAGGSRLPKDQVLPGLKSEIENDRRPDQYLEGAFTRFYGQEDDRLRREEELESRRKDLEGQQLQRAVVDAEIRRKQKIAEQREAEAEKLRPQTAKEIWADRGTAAQIGAALLIGLGGYAQGLVAARGGRLDNAALQMIQGGIDQEIQSQRARFEDALAKGKRADNDYEKALAIYGSPEAAALDLKVRQYALTDALNKTRAEQIGSQEALDNAIGISQGLRIEREKAKQELFELERNKALMAARAAAGDGGQAAALARQGIIKIGKDFYTVDKRSGQFVPLDKAAELATKARGGPTAQKADSVVATIDVLGQRMRGKPAGHEVFSPENQNIVTRGVRSAINSVAGDRTVLPGNEKQRKEAELFDQIRNDLMSQTSVINGQGAMSDAESKRAEASLGRARTWGELQRAQAYLREKAAAAASAYDGAEP